MKITTIPEAEQALYAYVQNSQRLGDKAFRLEPMRELMKQLGNSQDSLRVIHVAGTSGKTSTCYYIASLLQAAGYRTGLTISPHYKSLNERIQINLQPMPPEQFGECLREFLELVEKSGLTMTYFLVLVAFVYWTFAKEQVDYAVVETGLGGRLDGTNVVNSPEKICVITDIGLDHMEYLGDTEVKIAGEKAGIIHKGNTVFMLSQAPEVLAVFQKRATEVGAKLYVIDDAEQASLAAQLGSEYHALPLFQQRNAILAYKVAAEALAQQGLSLQQEQGMNEAFKVHVPGRMEIHTLPTGQTLLLDGAHNPQKLSALMASVRQQFPEQPTALLLGMKESKDYQAAIDELSPYVTTAICTQFSAMQDLPIKSIHPQLLADYLVAQGVPTKVVSDYQQAVEVLLARPERLLLVTGSIYLLGQVKHYLEQHLD